MGRHSEIHDLEREIARCEEELDILDREERIIRRLQDEITNEVEEPVKRYDMTVADEFRGTLESSAEDIQNQIYSETRLLQEHTSELLSEMVRARDRIHEHIEKCRRRIEQLLAEIEAESHSSAM